MFAVSWKSVVSAKCTCDASVGENATRTIVFRKAFKNDDGIKAGRKLMSSLSFDAYALE